jgi:dipeptidyl aminopeptidase/acylaminoacyl peptidase
MAKVPHRDRLLMQSAPFDAKPREVMRLDERFSGIAWSDSSGFAIVDEYERERRWTRTFAIDVDAPATPPRILWDLSDNDRYRDPGSPLYRVLPNGSPVMHREGSWLYLSGAGASPEGDRPFLDRYDLSTGRTERLFRSGRQGYEAFVAWIDPAEGTFLTRRESPRDPPNFEIRALGARRRGRVEPGEAEFASTSRALTRFPDPTPRLRGITKRIVKYKRADGVPLTFTLYLPPGYRDGTRLPTVFWAYPLEYSDAETAGQVAGSDRRFLTIGGASHLFFLLDGYAVLDNVSMPVIGHPDSVYNTFVDQIAANAKAAIDKAVALGVTDRERVGVAGHSHGALMTANLLAHTDLFRAGIARSGAYNHTLRPFGFQSERRTLWEAPEVYVGLSPLMHANKIREPLLLIHGELDVNPGTVPLQSDLLYRAIVGTGGTARLVLLPLESHGYEARESVEHTLWEMTTWFDRYVKGAAPRPNAQRTGAAGAAAPEGVKR